MNDFNLLNNNAGELSVILPPKFKIGEGPIDLRQLSLALKAERSLKKSELGGVRWNCSSTCNSHGGESDSTCNSHGHSGESDSICNSHGGESDSTCNSHGG